MTRRLMAIAAAVLLIVGSRNAIAGVRDYDTALGDAGTGSESALLVSGDGGDAVHELAVRETVYVAAKELPMYQVPGKGGAPAAKLRFGAEVERIGICENGMSHVVLHGSRQDYSGYVDDYGLTDSPVLVKTEGTAVISSDCEILDYPSRRDGNVVGEALAEDVVRRTADFGEIWTRIVYQKDDGQKGDGYILTTSLKGYENMQTAAAEIGSLHESGGTGVFADAVEGVGQAGITVSAGVLIGTPEAVGETVTLKPLGIFRITHYCPCSICCGPYTDGITSTGVTAVTNHTIAVEPSQIPYGSRVAINGQVYVAEDCGGAIRENCIDVYVATHEEALARGVLYTEVYLVE